MTEEDVQALLASSAGGKIAEARRHGVDLTLIARNMLTLTPKQRFEKLEQGAANLKFLRGKHR